MYIVKRTCTEISDSEDQAPAQPQTLAEYRDVSAYVLLGDPGAGKTTSFEQEAQQPDVEFVSARDLITYKDRQEWRGKTLFIDGLDEVRAGSQDSRTPFDTIRACLDKLGRPRFRLSCREADWLSASDREHLKSVSPDGQVRVLHLNPLTEADVAEILKHNPDIPDAEKFIRWAEQKNLSKLLFNPQVLDMLAKAVVGGNWPETRKQAFELACQTIIREHNQEHLDATRTQPYDVNQRLNATGFLCAVQLIAGNAGYALSSDMADNVFPDLNNLAFENIELLRAVSETKLFKKGRIEGQQAPVHRHIAEYLAARYLSEQVDEGLPIKRILALITGEDGIVVAELRGLSAWLAALCKRQRNFIIDRDPLGAILYGDVQEFTTQNKRQLLISLQREADRYPWFKSAYWKTSPFGALATPDMEPEFREILTDPDRGESHQALANCVLDALFHGERLLGLNKILLHVVRDATWWPSIRLGSLEAYSRNSQNSQESISCFKALLTDISSGQVPDLNDDLLAYLLNSLYPEELQPSDILNFLHSPKQPNYAGRFDRFWNQKILDCSSDANIISLLDAMTTRLDSLQPILDEHHFHSLATNLLSRGLNIAGNTVDANRIYGWLGIGLDSHGWPRSESDQQEIRLWLEAHPDIQKGVRRVGIKCCLKKEKIDHCLLNLWNRLFHADPPDDYGSWCLKQIQDSTDDQVAQFLFFNAIDAVANKRADIGLSLETLERYAQNNKKYTSWLEDRLSCSVDWDQQAHEETMKLRRSKERQEKQTWLDFVRSQENELRESKETDTQLLYNLAQAYFGRFSDAKGDSPLERLNTFLDQDEKLIQSVLTGLKNVLKRDDIPSVKDIIQIYTENKTYHLSQPFLAGLQELTHTSLNNISLLNDVQIRQAIAFQLTVGTDNEPEWYEYLLKLRPELVAEVYIKYVIASLRSNKQHVAGIYALAYINEYNQLARDTSLPLLKAYPVRCTNLQLNDLNYLLKAALRYADRQELLRLIINKLNRKSMNVAQHGYWLMTGLIVSPEKYTGQLETFAIGNESRIRHLAGFLGNRGDQWSPLRDLPVQALGLLIRLIGSSYAPYSLHGESIATQKTHAADCVGELITHLSALPGKDVTELLDSFLNNVQLQQWHNKLNRAKFEQSAVHREASFTHLDINQVSQTLQNLKPANAADLVALTTDILHDMADQIRNGNTDDYRQYWNEDSKRKLTTPKHEDACRDALLSDLQQRFTKYGIDAQPEGHYADDNRADIRVVFNGFEVPIEIKKNTNTELWSAIHNQLIAKYTREPRANGFGIYVVFWFGADKTKSTPRPKTAKELGERLLDTLSVEEARKISIYIIDVAPQK